MSLILIIWYRTITGNLKHQSYYWKPDDLVLFMLGVFRCSFLWSFLPISDRPPFNIAEEITPRRCKIGVKITSCSEICGRFGATIVELPACPTSKRYEHFNIHSRGFETLRSFKTSLKTRFIGTYMGPIWGRQDPGGPHVVPMNFAIWEGIFSGYWGGPQGLCPVNLSVMRLPQFPWNNTDERVANKSIHIITYKIKWKKY